MRRVGGGQRRRSATGWLWRETLCAAGLAAALVAAVPLAPAAQQRGSRVVAVGDIHGNLDDFVALLKHAGLLDDALQWIGGTAVLVQTGDYLDRGAKIRELMDLLMALEHDAARSKGRAIVLMGNHESMNATGELRDVAREAYVDFVDAQSEERRQAAYAAHVKLAAARRSALAQVDESLAIPAVYLEPDRDAWMQAHPPGMIEYLEAFGPQGHYGKWLRERAVAVRVGDTVFVHGGLNPQSAPRKIENATEQAHKEIGRFDRMRKVMIDQQIALPSFTFGELLDAGRSELERAAAEARRFAAARQEVGGVPPGLGGHPLLELLNLSTWSIFSPDGPLWFRGFATWRSAEGAPYMDQLQRRYGAVRFVVGHTIPADMRITPRFSSRVFLIDTGMLSSHYEGGRASALEIADGQFTAITLEDRRVLLNSMTANMP